MAKMTRRPRSRHTMSFLMILLVIFSTLAPLIPLAKAQPPTISLDPALFEGYLPGDTFDLNVRIDYADNVFSWQFELSFMPFLEVLEVTIVEEGYFLQKGGSPTYMSSSIKNVQGLVQAGCTITAGETGESGSGTLATVSFKVLGGGNSTLDLHDTRLLDPATYEIEHDVGPDGLFKGKAPYASFNTSPRPDVEGYAPAFNTTITFDASRSYDPDGGTIEEYFWDFADGNTYTTASPITTHVYVRPPPGAEAGEYEVNLTITDNQGYKDWASKTVRVYIRDIAITQVKVNYKQVTAGTSVKINVTVENLGSNDENFTVTTFYNDTVIDSQYVPYLMAKPPTPPYLNIKNLTFTWNTTGLPIGEYTIKANATTNPGENNMTNNELVWGNVTIELFFDVIPTISVYGVTFEVRAQGYANLTSELTFDYGNKQFLIGLGGDTGYEGNCTITIPQRMLNATIPPELLNTTITTPLEGGWSVLMNGSFTPYKPTRNNTHYFIYFNFTFTSTFEVQIVGTKVPIPPQPFLTISKTRAFVDELITLDASQSYDPEDIPIVTYYWKVSKYDPGIGEYRLIWNHTTATPMDTFSHNESALGINILYVTLTVTNEHGFKNTTRPQTLEIFYQWDLALTAIVASPTTVRIRELASINVTLQSTLSLHGDTLCANVTIYGNNTKLAQSTVVLTPPQTTTVALTWNTTDFATGVYVVKANVTAVHYGGVSDFPSESDTSDNEKLFGNMIVKKWDSKVSLLATPTSLTIGSSVSMLGSVSLATTGINVTLQSKLGDETWKNITTVKTDKKGDYSHTWSPAQTGSYQLKALSHGNATISMNASSVVAVTVNKVRSSISISVDPKSANVGSKVTISGAITPVRAGVAVKINYRKAGETSWTLLQTVTTDSEGKYSHEWETTEAGTYDLQASWEGDVNTLPSQSDIEEVAVQGEGLQNYYIYIAAGAILAVVVVAAIYFLKKRKA